MPNKLSQNSTELAQQAATTVAKQKRKRNRPDLANFGEENVKPGDNSRFLRNALVGFNLPPIDISDEKQVEQRIKDYFEWCLQNDNKPKVMGICNWLGISRDTLNEWKNGKTRGSTHSDVIKKVYTVLEELWETYMQENAVNTVSGIFLGKVFFGYREPTEVIITPGNPLATDQTPEEIAEKYKQLPEE